VIGHHILGVVIVVGGLVTPLAWRRSRPRHRELVDGTWTTLTRVCACVAFAFG